MYSHFNIGGFVFSSVNHDLYYFYYVCKGLPLSFGS